MTSTIYESLKKTYQNIFRDQGYSNDDFIVIPITNEDGEESKYVSIKNTFDMDYFSLLNEKLKGQNYPDMVTIHYLHPQNPNFVAPITFRKLYV